MNVNTLVTLMKVVALVLNIMQYRTGSQRNDLRCFIIVTNPAIFRLINATLVSFLLCFQQINRLARETKTMLNLISPLSGTVF